MKKFKKLYESVLEKVSNVNEDKQESPYETMENHFSNEFAKLSSNDGTQVAHGLKHLLNSAVEEGMEILEKETDIDKEDKKVLLKLYKSLYGAKISVKY